LLRFFVRRRRRTVGACGVTVNIVRMMNRFLVLVLLTLFTAPAFAQGAGGRVLVVPFENVQREPRLHWLGEASAVLLADALNARGVSAITRAERVEAFEQLRLPVTATLTRATVIKVGQMVGAAEAIVGVLRLEGDDFVAEARAVRIDVGRLQPAATERGPLKDLFGIFERLSARLAGGAAGGPAAEPQPPLDAFENYIKGLLAESPATRATFLDAAIEQFPRYDRARLALWDVRTEQGDDEAALAVARGVAADSRLAQRAAFRAGVSLLNLKRHDEAFDTFQGLVSDRSGPSLRSAAVHNNLGIVQLRRGGAPQTGTATYYLTQAADAEPNDADYLFNLGYAYMIERDNKGAIYWLREAVRRNPADADAHFVLAAALQASGSPVEATREQELARQLADRYEGLERQAAADRLPVPRGLERVRLELDAPRPLLAEQAIVNTAQREQRELAAFHLDRGRRLFEREQDREAMAELRRAVYLLPYEAQAHLLMGRIHLRAGRPKEAIDALKISVWSEDTAAARTALGEAYVKSGDRAAAREHLARALQLDPESAEAKRLLNEISK
jgi:tetratricopeptide (TPR) repeat protein